MNINEPNSEAREWTRLSDRPLTGTPPTDEELRHLAQDIVKYCPSLTHLLLALGSKGQRNPLQGLN